MMMRCEPNTLITDDIEFIANHYKEYFSELKVQKRNGELVVFTISPVSDPNRHEMS